MTYDTPESNDSTRMPFLDVRVSCQGEYEDNTDSHSYVGLTQKTVHNRMKQHLKSQGQKKSNNPMYRHDCYMHNGTMVLPR